MPVPFLLSSLSSLSSNPKIIQLKIYYLFILSDGRCSVKEQEKFDAICQEMHIKNEKKWEIEEWGDSLPIRRGDNSMLVLQELDKLLGNEAGNSWPMRMLNCDVNLQAETIWTLINLGYADTEFSDPEKKVVGFLAQKWDLKDIIIDELMETADTILMLTKQKDWLKTTTKSYDEISRGIQEADKKIELMFDNIKAAISEADAV